MKNPNIYKISQMIEPYKKYHYPLFVVRDNGVPDQIGTFLLLRTGSSIYLLTAAHAANDCKLNGYYAFAAKNLIEFTGKEIKTDGNDDDKYDIAVLKLDKDIPEHCFNMVTEEMLMVQEPSLNKIFSFMGYPCTKTKINNPSKHITCNLYAYYNTSCPEDVYFKEGLNYKHHIGIHFEAKKCLTDDRQKFTFPKPQGISGGGIWFHDIVSGHTWLAGIATTRKKPSKYIFGTHISQFLKIIHEDSECGK